MKTAGPYTPFIGQTRGCWEKSEKEWVWVAGALSSRRRTRGSLVDLRALDIDGRA